MRRSILIALSATAMAGAMAVGPFGVAGAAPYVYGCTPAILSYGVLQPSNLGKLSIYNGSASAANLTIKVLAGNGSILSTTIGFEEVPVTSTLPATHTAVYVYTTSGGIPAESNGTVAASIRIVSNVPVAATLSLIPVFSTTAADVQIDDCASLQP